MGPEMFRDDALKTMNLIVTQLQDQNTAADDQQVNYLHQVYRRARERTRESRETGGIRRGDDRGTEVKKSRTGVRSIGLRYVQLD